jgi:hypothetical protein
MSTYLLKIEVLLMWCKECKVSYSVVYFLYPTLEVLTYNKTVCYRNTSLSKRDLISPY